MSKPPRDFRTASVGCYRLFSKAHPELAKKVNSTTFIAVVKSYNEQLSEYALSTGNQVFLPFKFGILFVNRKRRVSLTYTKKDGTKGIGLSVDWQKTKEIGKRVFHMNTHTDGYSYYFMWRKNKKMAMGNIWIFKVTRQASRDLAFRLKNDPDKYQFLYHDWKYSDNQTKHKNR